MPNPSIPLQLSSLDTGAPVRQYGQDQRQNALTSQQILQEHYKTLDLREQSRLTSTVAGAAQLKQYLDNNDLEGAQNFLVRRRQQLQQRIGNGEAVDTQETDYALQAIRSGNVNELKNEINGLIAAGRVYGIVDQPDVGGSTGVLVNRMIAEQQARGNTSYGINEALRDLKGGLGQEGRNVADINTGYEANYQTQGGSNAADLQYKPQIAEETARAEMRGRGEISEQEKQTQGEQQVSATVDNIFGKLDALAKEGGLVDTRKTPGENIFASMGASDLGQYLGRLTGDQKQALRNQLRQQKPALINAIRRATGMSAKAMDSNTELQFYLQQVTDEKIDIQTNLEALRAIEQIYGQGRQIPDIGPGGGASILVKNPQTGEEFYIDPSDLPAAQAEGFQQQ